MRVLRCCKGWVSVLLRATLAKLILVLAEDMEYDACLNVAAGEQDSLKRIAFVGAFAMSNYSSTIGRVAKPFNPLLSQSYEYAIPGRYRYISEQVSHHPVRI